MTWIYSFSFQQIFPRDAEKSLIFFLGFTSLTEVISRTDFKLLWIKNILNLNGLFLFH